MSSKCRNMTEKRKRKKNTVSCDYCRKKKVKCSGSLICFRCQNDDQECHFEEPTKRGPPKKNKSLTSKFEEITIYIGPFEEVPEAEAINTESYIATNHAENGDGFLGKETANTDEIMLNFFSGYIISENVYRSDESKNVFFGADTDEIIDEKCIE